MENTNKAVVENEQEVEEVKVEVIKKDGFFKKTGNALKNVGKNIKEHPLKTCAIVLTAGSVIVGTVAVIKKIADVKNGDPVVKPDDSVEILTADSVGEMIDKLTAYADDQKADGLCTTICEAADTVADISEEVTDGITE